MDISTHSYDGTDNRNSIRLSDALLCTGAANQENEIGCDQGAAGYFRRANEKDGDNGCMDDTASMEAFRDGSGRKDAVLHIDPSGRGDYQEKRPILYTYENGVEDDDIRRSIVQRKRELDADDQERKERTRSAEEGLDRKIREGVIEFAATSNRVSAVCQEFERRLQRCLSNALQKQKDMYDNLMTRLEERLRRSEEELQNLRVKYDSLQMDYEKLKKDVENL